jgi:prepilin-type N-terminal cleavage/methylation domain-containing protein
MFKNSQKAFTIVELLVTVVIIALLTGIVVARLSDAKLKSRDAKRVSDINQLQLALDLYFDRCNQYPQLSATNHLMDLTASNGCPTLSDGTQITFGTFLSKIPTPPTSLDYIYGLVGPNNSTTYTAPTDYVLRATLERPNQATADDIDTLTMPTGYVVFYYQGSPPTGGPAVGGFGCTDSSTTSYYCVQPR